MATTSTSSHEFAQQLRSSNQRATPQRVLILSVLSEAGTHLTADEVYQRLGPMGSALNRSTVYRTLERFRDAGIVSETDLGGGVRVFERLATHRHHHLVCSRCNDMVEIDDTPVESMRLAIREQYGFEPHADHLAIWGVCPACSTEESG